MSGYVYESKMINGLIVNVVQDMEPENPIEGHPLCHLILGGPLKRYTDDFAKQTLGRHEKTFQSWSTARRLIEQRYPGAIIQPIEVYQHGRMALDTVSFQGRLPQGHYEFDVAVAGLVFTTKDKARKFYGTNKVTDAIRGQVLQLQREKVQQLAAFVNGDVYAWELTQPDVSCEEDERGNEWCEDADEYLDSCGGYYSIQSALAAGVEAANEYAD